MVQDIIDGITASASSISSSISSGIDTAFSSFAGGLQDFVIGLIRSAYYILFKPIDYIISNFFSGLATSINSVATAINNFIDLVVTMPLSWFFHILPPTTRSLLLIYFTIIIAYYGIILGYKAILSIINIIHKIKLI